MKKHYNLMPFASCMLFVSCFCGILSAGVVYYVDPIDIGPAGTAFVADTIDDQGRVVVEYYPAGSSIDHWELGVWDGVSLVDMGWTDGVGYDMVDGQVVGVVPNDPSYETTRARYFQSDESQDIHDNRGWATSGSLGVNSSGKVVGVFGTSAYDEPYAFIWQSGFATEYGLTGWDSLDFFDINDAGKVLIRGTATADPEVSPGPHRGIWYDTNLDGVIQTSEITETTGVSLPLLINNKDQVFGKTGSTWWVWDNGTLTEVKPVPGYTASMPNNFTGMNDLGEVVGRFGSSGSYAPFVWKDGVTYNLNDLLAGQSWALRRVSGINNSGQIAGYGYYGGGIDGRAVVMTPVPVLTAEVSGAVSADITYDPFGNGTGGYAAGLPDGSELVGGTASIENLQLPVSGFVTMQLFYDEADLAYRGIVEDTLRLYWYDDLLSQWVLAGNTSNLTWNPAAQLVMGDPTDILGDWGLCMSSHFVWANVDHASTFAMAGHPATVPAPGALVLGLIGVAGIMATRRFRKSAA